MDLTTVATGLGALAALSVATERITETIKGLPVLSTWLAVEQPSKSAEEFRKATLHILAMGIGTILAGLTHNQLHLPTAGSHSPYWVYLLFGAMAGGGAGLWNSVLDMVREANKQKQIVTGHLQSNPPPLAPR